MSKYFYILAAASLLLACQSNKQTEDKVGLSQNGDTVRLSEQSIILPRLQTTTIALQDYSAQFQTIGTVKAISGRIAQIAPPFDGRLSKSFIQLGQKVQAGSPIFELHSADYFEATKTYYQSLQTKKMTESNLLRQKDLVKNGVGTIKDLEEAETEYELSLKEHENSIAALQMFNVKPEQLKMGQPLKVLSPIAGEVVKTDIVIGQFVKSDDEPLAIVAELSQVWVAAQVKEKDISALHNNDKVRVYSNAKPDEEIEGTISHIGELLDEENRSIEVLITCNNPDRSLKPGMFTNVQFLSQPYQAVLIPATSLLQTEEESYVFVQLEKGVYLKRSVTASVVDPYQVLITQGLSAGETVVSKGGIYLFSN